MALIIKGDMPTCCGLCWECLGGGADAYYCNRAKRQISEVVPPYDKRMEWCPIIGEIPDKHGRLVDADAFKKSLIEARYTDNPNKEKTYNKALDILFDAPTVLEAST